VDEYLTVGAAAAEDGFLALEAILLSFPAVTVELVDLDVEVSAF